MGSFLPLIPMTRAAFLALEGEKRNEVKQVPFFVPAVFQESPSKRNYQSALHCNLIFLDIDPEKEYRDKKWVETGKYPAAPFLSKPDLFYSLLGDLNFAAHVTASSTPEKPRMRVVIDASAIPLKLYARAVNTIGMMLGLTVTTESKVAVQPMFLPTRFSDTAEDEDPLIAVRLDGRTFTVGDISDSATTLEFSEPKDKEHPGLDALEFLRAPVPEITLAIAKDALSHIDPDCDFWLWTYAAMALRHQFYPKLDDEAFELFNEWSSGGNKYGGQDKTEKKWNDVNPTSVGRAPITIRTLLKEAVAGGWEEKKVKETCFQNLVRWLEEVDTVTDLMEQGVKRILAAPLLSNVQEDVLVNMLCKQARSRFAYTIGTAAIRKDLSRLKTEIKEAEKPIEKLREPLWAKGVCYISAANEFFRHRTGEKYKPEAFNASYSRWLLPTEESLKNAGIAVTPAALSKPLVSPNDYALNHLKIPAVYDYAYDPSQPTDMFFIERGRKYVNTYSPTYPEASQGEMDIAGILFQKHLRNLILEPEYQRTITDFLAFLVQHPGQKVRWAVLVQSVEGAGKTFLAEVMKAVLGSEHVKTISDIAIKSGYNEWSFGHQLVVLEEVRVVGTNRHEIMNALKPLITNDDVSINEKFRNQREVKNISNYMAFSNYPDALALTPGDRRWFVIKSPLQHKSQVLALGENYFPPLYAMLRNMAGALRAWFLDWEISSSFNADGHAPRTQYVQEIIDDTANDVTAAVRRLIKEGDYSLIQYDIISAKVLTDVLRLEEGLTSVTSQHLAQVLRDEGYIKVGRHLLGTERHYLWIKSGVPVQNVVAQALDRMTRGLKNLNMELIYA